MGIRWQLSRYTLVGIASNTLLYVVYLMITGMGIGHKTAMTLLYTVGVLQTFFFNRAWTFRYRGSVPGSLWRYGAAYLFGYLFNLAALFILVDRLGLPHQPVQGILILTVAGLLFLLQRHWVFPGGGTATAAESAKSP